MSIKIEVELRPCKQTYSDYNALFHSWTTEGMAIIERANGEIDYVHGSFIKFLDSKFDQYSFHDLEECPTLSKNSVI